MTPSSQKPQRRISEDYETGRARHYGLRAVARALGLSDFVELRRTSQEVGKRPRGPRPKGTGRDKWRPVGTHAP